jgi:hypothetical protein
MRIETKPSAPRSVSVSQVPKGSVVRRVSDDRLFLVAFSTSPYSGGRHYLIDLETGEYQSRSQDHFVIPQDAVLKVSGDAS